MNIISSAAPVATRPLPQPRARVGLIIPSVNTCAEPQFNQFAPEGLGVYVARARVAGPWKRPLPEMTEEIATAAKLLSDCAPDLIVFHCTDTSMSQGPQGEGRILDIVRDATGIEAMATSRLVLDALKMFGLRKVVLLTPYKSNRPIIDYLAASDISVVRDVALGVPTLDYVKVTPQQWIDLAIENNSAEADGIFLSCANTTQIEAVADLEQKLGKPVVNSNQAVLWGCVKRLRASLAPLQPMPHLGRLMQSFN